VRQARASIGLLGCFWQTLNKNVAALQDRGHVLFFEPGAAEVHRQARTWFDDAEIYEWFAANLHRVREPSLRHYVRAKELKAAGMDWTDVPDVEAENRRARGSDSPSRKRWFLRTARTLRRVREILRDLDSR
jgi:hypothetical protein